ncbi:uncharacterized protein DDB_G0271670 [Octopus bimaculoides]|nr:uncharacterized protein DDB_G0271670 [Octopus bimaculoides]
MQSAHNSVKTEILTSETDETLSSSTAADGTPGNAPQKRRVGRPVGSKTKPKPKVLDPVRSSQRQRGRFSKPSDDSKPSEPNEEPTAKRKRRRTTKGATNWDSTSFRGTSSVCLFSSPTAVPTPGMSQNQSSSAVASLLSSSAASSSSSSSSSAAAAPPTTTTGEQELLSKLSPSLVQQVISQEVQVKPIGTYMNVTPP